MKRGNLIIFGVIIAVCIVLASVWMIVKGEAEPEIITIETRERAETAPGEAATPPPEPDPAELEAAPSRQEPQKPGEAAMEAFTRALKEVQEKEDRPDEDKPFEGVPITEETLTGCKYKQGKLEVMFAPENKWLINGRERAKWEVVGSKVRLYDDKGEEHWLDINEDKLMFNGQRIALWK